MKVYTLKNFLAALALTCLVPTVNAQFDDVYYDPDNVDLGNNYNNGASSYDYDAEEDVTYYDDEEYAYYDDYDFYYTSRIRRFYQPYSGFDFYDPYYVNYSYYDPFYSNSYYYPGSSIYLSFGNADYWSYRNWRRWNRWNRWNSYNSWNSCGPAAYYYSYNNWCSPSHNYWGGYHSYNSYSNYYNNYYNSCPTPVSNYYGITHSTVNTINSGGGTRGTYYGPRLTGNTGSSPRGPVTKPENVQPVFKGSNDGLTQSNDQPRETGGAIRPGINAPTNPVISQPSTDQVNEGISTQEKPAGRTITIDKELKKDEVTPTSGRPVFRPYPSNDRPNQDQGNTTTDRSTSRPTPEARPTPSSRDTYNPRQTPQYEPTPRNSDDRPRYTPPARNDDKPSYTPRNENRPRNDDRPSYSPPARNNNERSDDRPSNPPSQRSNDSNRSNDRPSYSPPPRNESSSGSRSSSPSPQSRDNSSSRSNSNSGSSPRSPGKG